MCSDGDLLYHHSPAAYECVGIDAATQSVYVVHGIGEGDALFWTGDGTCDANDGGAFGGGSPIHHNTDDANCYTVGGDDRVRDISFDG